MMEHQCDGPFTVADAVHKLNHMPPDEPVFILRAQDRLAPQVILRWIELLTSYHLPGQRAKIDGAYGCLKDFLEWPDQKKKLPD